MAIAIEDLTPEAQAIAARLHPAVKDYLEKKAGREAAEKADRAAARKSAASSRQGGQRSASRSEGGSGSDPLTAAADFERKLDRLTPGRGVTSSTGGRLVSAIVIGILVLEVLSYALGQPFSYSLKDAQQKLGDLSKTPYTPLFQGQHSPLVGHGL